MSKIGKLVLLLFLASPLSAQVIGAYNGMCSKGGQNVLVHNSPSSGTQPIGGGPTAAGSGVVASYPLCTVTVFLTGTTSPASLFSNAAGTQPLSNPFTSNTDGSFLFFSAGNIGYDVVLSGGGLPAVVTLTGIFVGAPGNGGGGSSVSFFTNGVLNASQTTFNLVNTPNFQCVNTSAGNVQCGVVNVPTGATPNGGLVATGTTLGLLPCASGQVLVSQGPGLQWQCGTQSSGPSLQVNGTANQSQGLLNLINGTGISVLDLGSGNVQTNLNQSLPSNEQATTQPTGDSSLLLANTQFVQNAIAAIQPAPTYSGNQLLSGGGIESIAGTLNVTVGAATYVIQGVQYASTLDTVTLATADPTNPRIDTIGLCSNPGASPCDSHGVFVLTGTPATTPVAPVANPITQLPLTTALVLANATSPTFTVVNIYHENAQAPTEWNTSSSGAPINLASTNNPYDGSVDIEATSAVTGNYAQMTDPSSGTVQMQNYNSLVFYVRSKAAWGTMSLAAQWFQSATPVGNAITIRNTGTFGFNSAQTASYQQISIPTSLFGINGVPVTSVRFTVSGSGGTIGFYLDDITLQAGQNSNPYASFLSFSGTWSSTTGYNPNNVVFYNSSSWVALTSSLNSTPSVVNTQWAPLFNCGTNQQVMYNAGGYCAGSAGLLYDGAGDLTMTGTMSSANVQTTGPNAWFVRGNEGTAPSGAVGQDVIYMDSSLHCPRMINNNGSVTGCIGSSSGTFTSLTTSSPLSGCSSPCTTTATIGITANGITATQLAAQYSKWQCEVVWTGSGTSNALQSGDDAPADQSCFNKLGVTKTITAVYCRSDNASNTTTINPTFGTSGTGTTILSGALTCGSSGAYSATGTVSNGALADGNNINPVMGGTLTGTSIHVLFVGTY